MLCRRMLSRSRGALWRVGRASSSEAGQEAVGIGNASAVVTASRDGRSVEVVSGADLLIRGGKVAKVGVGVAKEADMVVDAMGGLVTPGFVDPHTHLFPCVDRADEFALRPVLSYEEIAKKGGGILSTVTGVREAAEEDLLEVNRVLLRSFVAQGTTTVEVKSGYGLSLEAELKQMRVIRQLQQELQDVIDIVPTFLGAHATPPDTTTAAYVRDQVVAEMIPQIAELGLAEYVDVFCEEGYFGPEESRAVLEAGLAHGLRVRLHADEFVDSRGAELGAELGAHSADHLMAISQRGIEALAATAHTSTPTVPILLPGTTLFLGKGHGYAPAKALLEAGCAVALATDCNPGSSVYSSMPLMMQLGLTQMGMSLDQVFLAATFNPALSLQRHTSAGSLQPGADADAVIWSLQSLAQIPYYGPEARSHISAVLKRGRIVHTPESTHAIVRAHQANPMKTKHMQARGFATIAYSTTETRTDIGTKQTPSTTSPPTVSPPPSSSSSFVTSFSSAFPSILSPSTSSSPFASLSTPPSRFLSTTSSSSSSSSLSARDAGVVEGLTGFLEVNETGQIVRLPRGVDWSQPPPRFDSSLPHAPRRRTGFEDGDFEVAIRNVLLYFDPSLHAQVRPVAEQELRDYGHVYFYHLLPPAHPRAIPFSEIPGETTESRAMTHMILNNLDPAVAQFPQELITYGGNGAVFGNWAQFHVTVRMLARRSKLQTLSMLSGHPQGLFPAPPHDYAPAAVITNGLMVPHHSTTHNLDRLYAMAATMYGQMTAGSWMYIGPSGLVHGTTITIAEAIQIHASQSSQSQTTPSTPTTQKRTKKPSILKHQTTTTSTTTSTPPTPPPLFVSSGLGGMSGAQPRAAKINGAVSIVAEVKEDALRKRVEQGWLDEGYVEVEEVLARARGAVESGEAVSVGFLGNVVDLWEELARSGDVVVDLGSDQTSLHAPVSGGYYPAGLSVAEADEMMVEDEAGFYGVVQESIRRQMAAMVAVQRRDGTLLWDYGNSLLLEASKAGVDLAAMGGTMSSYVEVIMGPRYFDFGFGPYRWVVTSGEEADLDVTDKLAAEVIREQLADSGNAEIQTQLEANLRWIESAKANKLVVGSQARILYSDLEGRIATAVRMNEAVANGSLRAPVVIGRDHHDVSGTDSPWRETANIADGTHATADMSVQNFAGDAFRGATWISLHNGGGTGWGQASNGGFGLVLDGSPEAQQRAQAMLFFDVSNGLARRARAGNQNAITTVAKLKKKYTQFQPFLPIQE